MDQLQSYKLGMDTHMWQALRNIWIRKVRLPSVLLTLTKIFRPYSGFKYGHNVNTYNGL
jgi:hypothetical protein